MSSKTHFGPSTQQIVINNNNRLDTPTQCGKPSKVGSEHRRDHICGSGKHLTINVLIQGGC